MDQAGCRRALGLAAPQCVHQGRVGDGMRNDRSRPRRGSWRTPTAVTCLVTASPRKGRRRTRGTPEGYSRVAKRGLRAADASARIACPRRVVCASARTDLPHCARERPGAVSASPDALPSHPQPKPCQPEGAVQIPRGAQGNGTEQARTHLPLTVRGSGDVRSLGTTSRSPASQ